MAFIKNILWRVSVIVTLVAILATMIVLWLYYREDLPIENLTPPMWKAILAFVIICVILIVINIIRLATTFAIGAAVIYALVSFGIIGASLAFLTEVWEKVQQAASEAGSILPTLPIV